MKLNIKKGDKVRVIKGKDRNKKGKVSRVIPEVGKVVVEDANIMTRHARPRRQGEKGQKIQYAAPLDVSKVILICPKCNKPTRIGHKFLESTTKKGKNKVRVCKKCQAVMD